MWGQLEDSLPGLCLKEDVEQLLYLSPGFHGFGSHNGLEKALDTVQDTVSIASAEDLLVRPLVAHLDQLAHEGVLRNVRAFFHRRVATRLTGS